VTDFDLLNVLREAIGSAADVGLTKKQIIDELKEAIWEVEQDSDIPE
jgi:hypothetical protein